MGKLTDSKIIRIIVAALLAALALISILQGIRNAVGYSQDFQWDAARAIIDGVDPYEASIEEKSFGLSEALDEFYGVFDANGIKQKMEANQFPSLLMLLFPYAFISPLLARYAWIVSNILFTIGIIWLLRKTFLKNLAHFEFILCMFLMLAGTPYRNQLGVGQHTLFAFFFFLLAVWLDELQPKGNRVVVTLCMFVSYFKYTLTAPLTLYLLYRKRYREFAASVAAHIVLTFAAAAWLKKDVVYMIVAPLKVSSALSAEGSIDLGAIFNGSILYVVFGAVIAVVLMVITFRMPNDDKDLLFSVLLLWSLVLTYHRSYDYFVLIAVMTVFTGWIQAHYPEKTGKILFGVYLVLLLMTFFGLRLFNENIPSKIIMGIIYYVFTLMVTYMAGVEAFAKRKKEVKVNER